MQPSGEERFIARHLLPLSENFPGAFGLTDDCAEIAPLPGHSFIMKTDPVVEGVHFFADDAPEDLAWKALAVNISDLAAKAARPVAYLMALTLPAPPSDVWMQRFSAGLQAAQDAFGCVLIGGDTDVRPGPLSIAMSVIGEVPTGRMVRRQGAEAGDLVYVTGCVGEAALGLQLRLAAEMSDTWGLSSSDRAAALTRYLRPNPRLGLRAALRTHARSAMDISDGLVKDLDRMCRLTGLGARIEISSLPVSSGVAAVRAAAPPVAIDLVSGGDDYEILATVAPERSAMFEKSARLGGTPVTRIGHVIPTQGIKLIDEFGDEIELGATGYDHFDKK
jgi:thiamine-monophosphate kinase